MTVASGLQDNFYPNLYRQILGGVNLLTVSGAPARAAASITFMNTDPAAQNGAFTNADGSSCSIALPIGATPGPFYGNIIATGGFGPGVSCIVGWIDDGSVKLNP